MAKTLSGKIMVLLSRYEGFPMTILEALTYGNPCLVTEGTNMLNEIVENRLGWGTTTEPDQIAKDLQLAQQDFEQNRSSYQERCSTHVYSEYNWDKIARLSATIFKEMNTNA